MDWNGNIKGKKEKRNVCVVTNEQTALHYWAAVLKRCVIVHVTYPQYSFISSSTMSLLVVSSDVNNSSHVISTNVKYASAGRTARRVERNPRPKNQNEM